MKKSITITIQLIIFGALTALGIFYVMNQSPVDSMADYEKQEMVKPNRGTSVIDQFFKSDKVNRKNSAEDDDVSLMGGSGRYDEVRIGRSKPEKE